MSVLNCEVHLDNPKTTYQPGDKLTGCVTLTLEVRLLLKAVAIKYIGFAEVKWETHLPPKKSKKSKQKNEQTQKEPTNDDPTTPEPRLEVYTNREDFLSSVNYFLGSEDAIAKIVERGTYNYPFTVSLPQSCPSSFESTNGHIRYTIEVFVDHKNKSEIWYSKQLQVLKPLDLRHCPQVRQQPCEVHVEEKSVWKFFKKPLEMFVNLQQVGFIPGEVLSAHVIIRNPGSLHLNELTYELLQICRITASHGHKKTKTQYFTTILAKTVHNICDEKETMVQHLQTLFLPQKNIPPSTDSGDCSCLQISYELSVRLTTNNVKRYLLAKLPIIVGTKSLQNVKEVGRAASAQQQPIFVAHSTDDLGASMKARESNMLTLGGESDTFAGASAPEPETPPNRSLSMMSLASSTYREAEYMPKIRFDGEMKKSKRRDLGQTDFKPKYLYYNMESVLPITNDVIAASTSTTTVATTATTTRAISTTTGSLLD
ncbi:arrestin domain-containing protein 17-like [Rhagoletis pomonella]|uniref:arrestin domain-containing protein 17-like n=1 Tax=Rhagoletis pomonella TaxID=28610 RepID=UPI0017842D1F|nr:arrestin domain-containing protein 17-like [Rhagoletis pomonella]